MEEWKAIPGYDGLYEASSKGRIKSLFRIDRMNRKVYEKIRKVDFGGSGYLQVSLSKYGKKKAFSVHTLVAMAFLGHKPNGTQSIIVDHKDNDKTNNIITNLQLTTQRINSNKDRKGLHGCYFNKARKKWRSSIMINKKSYYLGTFATEIEASNAYQNKLNQLKDK